MTINKSVLFRSQSVEWQTPLAVYEKLHSEFQFDFDPCASDAADDGLTVGSWKGKRAFCNPPYGPGLGEWLERGLEADLAVFLLPARTDTKWFHDLVIPKAKEIRFIKGRLKFGSATENAPFPSMLVIFRKKKARV